MMKGKLYVFQGKAEIVLSDGYQYEQAEDETLDEFKKDIEAEVKDVYSKDLQLTERTYEGMRKTNTAALERRLKSSTGLEREMIVSILQSRK